MKRTDLLEALTKVKPGLANNDLIEQSNHFIFNDDKIITYNDHITITCNFDTGIQGTVKADELYKLLQKIKDDNIRIQIEEDELIIKGKKIKAGIKLNSEINIKLIDIKKDNWKELPDNFLKAVKATIFSASKDFSYPILTNLYIDKDSIISCDNRRFTKYKLDKEIENSFLLPADSAMELIKYDPIEYIIEENWVHFKNKENVLFSCRMGAGEYVDISEFLKMEGETIKLPDTLKEAINRIEILATSNFDHEKTIDIIIENNKLTCKADGDYGWAEEEIEIEYDGKEINFSTHPTFLKDILDDVTRAKVGKDSMLFKGRDFVHVMALIPDKKENE